MNHDRDLLSIHFSRHSFVGRGNFDVIVSDNRIEISLDEFAQMEFFFSDYLDSKILVDQQHATAFDQGESISLITEEKTVELLFISKKTKFMGHIMKGNRFNQQCESKDRCLYDHRIYLKKTVL